MYHSLVTLAVLSFPTTLPLMELLSMPWKESDLYVKNSGVDTSLFGWFDSDFGKWKDLVICVLSGLIIVVAILTLCGCCIIPCVRG